MAGADSRGITATHEERAVRSALTAQLRGNLWRAPMADVLEVR